MPYLTKPKKQKIRRVNRESRQKIYQSAEWKKLRLAKLQQDPLCELCLSKGIVTEAVDVHHIDSFTKYDGTKKLALAYNYANLLALCKQCHQKLHNKCGFSLV